MSSAFSGGRGSSPASARTNDGPVRYRNDRPAPLELEQRQRHDLQVGVLERVDDDVRAAGHRPQQLRDALGASRADVAQRDAVHVGGGDASAATSRRRTRAGPRPRSRTSRRGRTPSPRRARAHPRRAPSGRRRPSRGPPRRTPGRAARRRSRGRAVPAARLERVRTSAATCPRSVESLRLTSVDRLAQALRQLEHAARDAAVELDRLGLVHAAGVGEHEARGAGLSSAAAYSSSSNTVTTPAPCTVCDPVGSSSSTAMRRPAARIARGPRAGRAAAADRRSGPSRRQGDGPALTYQRVHLDAAEEHHGRGVQVGDQHDDRGEAPEDRVVGRDVAQDTRRSRPTSRPSRP